MKRYDDNRKKFRISTIIGLLFFLVLVFVISMMMIQRKTVTLETKLVEIETKKIQTSIDLFKKRAGYYPNLIGNENNLESLKIMNGNISFAEIYGAEKLYEIKSVGKSEKSTNVVSKNKEDKIGWHYDITTGKISSNIIEVK